THPELNLNIEKRRRMVPFGARPSHQRNERPEHPPALLGAELREVFILFGNVNGDLSPMPGTSAPLSASQRAKELAQKRVPAQVLGKRGAPKNLGLEPELLLRCNVGTNTGILTRLQRFQLIRPFIG